MISPFSIRSSKIRESISLANAGETKTKEKSIKIVKKKHFFIK